MPAHTAHLGNPGLQFIPPIPIHRYRLPALIKKDGALQNCIFFLSSLSVCMYICALIYLVRFYFDPLETVYTFFFVFTPLAIQALSRL